MMPERHRWLFSVEEDAGEEFYLDGDGRTVHAEEFFVGTDREAEVEGSRRADIWEGDSAHGMVVRITREGHGVLTC